MSDSPTKSTDKPKKTLTKKSKPSKNKMPNGEIMSAEEAEGQGGTFVQISAGTVVRL